MTDGSRSSSTCPGRAIAVRRVHPGDPVRRRHRVPRTREAEADPQRRRPAAGRAGRRRRRRHARRDPHAPADPRPRRPRLRGRGDRDRRRRRPPAERRRGDRHPVLRGPQDRRAEPAGDRRRAGRGPLRPRAPVSRRARAGSGPGCSPGCSSCRCSAATTPSWPPTRGCAAGTPGSRRSMGWRCRSSTAPARSCSRPRRRPTSGWWRSASSAGGSAAGIAASTSAGSTRRSGRRDCYPDAIHVLYAGRLTKEKGVELLADAFLEARRRDPRLRLVLAGGGPEEEALRVPPRRRGDCSSAGCQATIWPAHTRARTCSCSPAAPTRSAR